MSLELPFCNVNKTTDRITTTSDMKVGRSYYCFKIKIETRTCFIRYITWLILNATYFLRMDNYLLALLQEKVVYIH